MNNHRCIAGPTCRNTETINNQRHGALTEQPDTLCDPCHDHIQSCVKQLPQDWNQLRDALGERSTHTTDIVRATRTPSMPISTGKEVLMSAIVDIADRAAAIVSDALNTDQPTGRRPAPILLVDNTETRPLEGTPAYIAENIAKPHAARALAAAIAITEPNIDLLASAPAEPVYLWNRAGEDTELVELTGLQIAQTMVDLHNKTRAELGKTRLRHKYEMPCPRCWHSVGRDDGSSIITCDNKACGASWTEREYKLLAGLMAEGQETQLVKWWLAEAYSRLDSIQHLIDTITGDNTIDQPGAGTIILTELTNRLDGHAPAKARTVATDKAATSKRQEVQDQWSWSGEKPYRAPRRRTKPKPPYDGPRIAASSLTLDAPIHLPGPGDTRDNRCTDCNEIHAGECA